MAHVEDEHIETVCLWSASCGCGTAAKDATSLRYHLSDAHGLWKAEWKWFGAKEPDKEDEDPAGVASVPSLGNGDATRPRQRIECPSFRRFGSEEPPVPGPEQILPDRMKPSHRKKPGR